MAVAAVKIEADCFMVCLTHALSTEREEVMGLMIGEIEDSGIIHVYSVIMLQRLDKQKDRVEISPEQLSDASTQAEKIGLLTSRKKPMRIVGWYHSHPHITVWPSHVDLRTQATYQLMDEGFIGLIFSCFNEDTHLNHQVKLTCFQSVNRNPSNPLEYQSSEIELQIVRTEELSDATLESLVDLPKILGQEEENAYKKTLSSDELITSVHNGTVFTKALCELIEVICGPLLQMMENRLALNKQQAEDLKDQTKKLEEELRLLER